MYLIKQGHLENRLGLTFWTYSGKRKRRRRRRAFAFFLSLSVFASSRCREGFLLLLVDEDRSSSSSSSLRRFVSSCLFVCLFVEDWVLLLLRRFA